jgi:uncharacterized protein
VVSPQIAVTTEPRRAADAATVSPVMVRRDAQVFDVRIEHVRPEPFRYAFSYEMSTWLVDLDAVPQLPRGWRWLASFSSRDHLGRPDSSLRANVERFLAASGISLHGGQITMLATPRVLGYSFNPLSLHWCHRPDGTLVAVVAEVRNTYGESHCYLLHPDDAGRDVVDKEFYVSPFYPVDGHYRMSVAEPDERLAITLAMHHLGQRPFVATMHGHRRPGRPRLWRVLRSPLTTRAVMFHIKRHGITLYLKGLRPSRRPAHLVQPGAK